MWNRTCVGKLTTKTENGRCSWDERRPFKFPACSVCFFLGFGLRFVCAKNGFTLFSKLLQLLPPTLFAWFFVVGSALDVAPQPFFFTHALELFEGLFYGIVFSDDNFGQT